MYNESPQIRENVKRIVRALEKLNVSWEYFLVDDGSTDGSHEKALAGFAGDPRCKIIRYPNNRGRGYALRQGFDAATGNFIITTESDLSWGEEIIGELWNALQETNADVVIASVYAPGGKLENVPPFRYYLSKLGNIFLRLSFGGEITMFSGMTRGYRRKVIRSIYLEQNRKEIHLEIIDKCRALGFQINEIPNRQ